MQVTNTSMVSQHKTTKKPDVYTTIYIGCPHQNHDFNYCNLHHGHCPNGLSHDDCYIYFIKLKTL